MFFYDAINFYIHTAALGWRNEYMYVKKINTCIVFNYSGVMSVLTCGCENEAENNSRPWRRTLQDCVNSARRPH